MLSLSHSPEQLALGLFVFLLRDGAEFPEVIELFKDLYFGFFFILFLGFCFLGGPYGNIRVMRAL